MKIIQIWCAEKNMSNNLVEQMKKVVKKNRGLGLANIGGCGGFGNFTGVYSAYFKGQPSDSKIKKIIADFKKITTLDSGGHYHYGSAKVSIPESVARVTEAVLTEDTEFPKSVMQYWAN